MADNAYKRGTGARGLGKVVEQVLKPYKFKIDDYAGKEVHITIDYVKKVM